MSTPSKRKGSAFELEVVNYLRDHGFPYAERGIAGATLDIGDIIGTPGVVWECKNQKVLRLPEWVDELLVEVNNQMARYTNAGPADVTGAVIHKRHRTTVVARYFATMPLELYVNLLKEAGY